MILATPLGLLALLAIPAIVAIHMFRRRFPVQPVAGLFLWQALQQTPPQGRTVSKLPISASLLLECLAALAFALILAGARLSSAGHSPHLVVLLDDSASMAAANAQGESARDRVVRRVLDEVERLGSAGRVTLVRSGERPAVIAGPAAFAIDAEPALASWQPDAPHHSLALGVQVARQLADRGGQLMVMSDLPPSARGEPAVEGARWVSVGEPLANVGITAATRSLSPEEGRGAIALTLGNFSDAPARRRLDLTAGGTQVLTRDLDVPPGSSSLTLPLPPGLPAVRASLSADPLLRDNAVVLVEPRPRIVVTDNRLGDGRGREALLKALDVLSGVTRASPQGEGSAHVMFSDAAALDRPPASGVWRVGFGRAPAAWLGRGETRDFIGPFILEKRHPLLLGTTLGGVVWAGAAPLVAGTMRPLVSAEDQVLVGVAAGATARAEPSILFNIDLDRTNLIRTPDWPILISNVVDMRRQTLPGPERWNYRVGEWVRVRLDRTPKGPVRLRSGAVERDLPADRQLEFMAPAPGGLLQILDGEGVLFELGVNFHDEHESDLRHQTTADSGETGPSEGLRAEDGPASDPLFWLLLALGGAAIVADWWLLSVARDRV